MEENLGQMIASALLSQNKEDLMHEHDVVPT